jgi:predicted N-acetyltransferase YhbS
MNQEHPRTDPITIRTAAPADAENIARLVNAAFGPERFFIDGDRTSPDKVQALLHQGKFLLAEEAGTLAGCVYVELRGERGYFGLLSVDPSRQRTGLGSRLVALAENYCRDASCLFMDITMVNLRTPLFAYYGRLGYVENGTLPFPKEQHPPKVPCHLVKMFKPLK